MSGYETLIAESGALRAPIGLVLGALAGSIAATLLIRWPDRRRALTGRSRCDACGRPLEPREIVPLVSFFALAGRCRSCRVPIDPRHTVLELAAAALGMLVLALQPGWTGLASAVLGWWLLLVAALDLDRRWLPPVLTLPLIPLGLALAWAGIGPPPVERAAVAAAAFVLLWLSDFLSRRLFRRESLYPGLAQLAAGLGAWLGGWLIPAFLVAGLLVLVPIAVRWKKGAGGTPALGVPLALAAWIAWLIAAPSDSLLPL